MSFKHVFHPSTLREYDVRGIVDETLFYSDALALGRVFGTLVSRQGGTRVGICYDGRHSSPIFAEQLTQGLNLSGINVENFGLGPTPLAYFGLHHRNLDAVMVVTGSHNPTEYNSIKMALKTGPVYGAMIKELGHMAERGDVITVATPGTHETVFINDAYIKRLAGDYRDNGKKPLKIVWDAGNGAAGAVLHDLVAALPGEHTLLFDEVDGEFPNHHPDPSVEKNLADLKRAVEEKGADLGIAFDGDGDRIGVVTASGQTVWSDQLTALYARDILERQPKATIILDVKCSQTVMNMIAEWGSNVIVWKVGNSLAKAKMQETGAALAGELSGHIFFKEGFYGHDDALYCAVRVLNVIQKYGPLDQQLKLFPAVHTTPEVRFTVRDEEKFAIVERARNYLRDNVANVSVLDIDGVRVSNEDGWWLLRASNTQNVLTIRAESTTTDGLQRVIKSLKMTLHNADCAYPEPLF